MAVCYIVSRAIVLQGGWPLFYIEWGWCWWTIIILISTTLWRLVCSFSHCWHSYLRLSDNVLRHRKTTPELWRAKEWWFYKFQFTSRSTHLVGGCSFCILNIAYPAAGRKRVNEIDTPLAWVLKIGTQVLLIRVNVPDIIIHSLPQMNRFVSSQN